MSAQQQSLALDAPPPRRSRSVHDTIEAARGALARMRCWPLHVHPGEPETWLKLGTQKQFRIGREQRPRSARFHIVEVR